MGEHRQAAGRLTGDRHVERIAAELADVALHPTQRGLLIHQPVVARRTARPRRQRGMRQEPERAEAVVDRDDHRSLSCQQRRVIVPSGVSGQATPVDPHQNRAPRCVGIAKRRRVHVQIQTVLIQRTRRREGSRLLGAARRELGRISDAVPRWCGLRCLPPEWPGRRCGIRHTAEHETPVRRHATDRATLGLDNWIRRRARGKGAAVDGCSSACHGDDEGRRCCPAGDEPATLKVSGHGTYSFGLDGKGGRSWSVRSGTDRLDRFAMRMAERDWPVRPQRSKRVAPLAGWRPFGCRGIR